VLAGIGSLLYALKLLKLLISSLILLACSLIGFGYGPSSGHVKGPIATIKALGNTLKAGNIFSGPDTIGLVCFQGLVFKNLDKLLNVFFSFSAAIF